MSWSKISESVKSSGKADFLKLKVGQNRIRMASMPEERLTHFDNANKPHNCTGDRSCDMCAVGARIKKGYVFNAIDRTDNTAKVIEVGKTVMESIDNLRQSADWGFDELPDYDITISREGSGMETKYHVTPNKPAPLSADDQALIASMKPVSEVLKDTKKDVATKYDNKPAAANTNAYDDDDIRVEDMKF